jgi:hypothetical protein
MDDGMKGLLGYVDLKLLHTVPGFIFPVSCVPALNRKNEYIACATIVKCHYPVPGFDHTNLTGRKQNFPGQ